MTGFSFRAAISRSIIILWTWLDKIEKNELRNKKPPEETGGKMIMKRNI
jgi:hypothetical protein